MATGDDAEFVKYNDQCSDVGSYDNNSESNATIYSESTSDTVGD